MINRVVSKSGRKYVTENLEEVTYLLDTVRSPYNNYYLCSFSRNYDGNKVVGIGNVWAHSSGRYRKYDKKRYILIKAYIEKDGLIRYERDARCLSAQMVNELIRPELQKLRKEEFK